MTYQNRAIAALCGFAEQEGLRYGGAEVSMAVAEVIHNRVRAGWGDWLPVIADAPNKAGTLHRGVWPVNPRDASFQKLLRRVDDIYHGVFHGEPMTDGALFFADLNQIDRPWFQWHIINKRKLHPIKGTVGPVTFFG